MAATLAATEQERDFAYEDPAAPPGWRTALGQLKYPFISFLSVGGVLAVWEASVRLRWVDPFFFSSPSRVGARAYTLFASGEIFPHILISTEELMIGFLGAVALGVPLGLLAGWYRRLDYLIDPWVTAIYSTPRLTLLPLIVIWVGIGLWSKVFAVFIGALFPILLNTITGVRATDAQFIRAARCFGAGDRRLFLTVVLPGSLHAILAGVRLGFGRAMVGIVSGEFFASNAGLGFLLLRSGQTLDTTLFFVAVVLLIIIGLIITEVLRGLERHFERWRADVHA